MSLREKKKHETRTRIFDVSAALFKEKGFENTTVDEITKEAGIAKGTFFNYFPTKEALLFYFKEQKEEFVRDLMTGQMSLNAPVKERLMDLFVLVAEHYEKDKELSRLLFFEHKRLIMASGKIPSGSRYEGHGPGHFVNMLCSLLQEGIQNGEIRQTVDPMVAAKTLHAIYFHSLMGWLHSNTDYSFSNDISAKVDLLFTGIGE